MSTGQGSSIYSQRELWAGWHGRMGELACRAIDALQLSASFFSAVLLPTVRRYW